MFWKRKKPEVSPKREEPAAQEADAQPGADFPWKNDAESYIACNLATGNLATNLAKMVATKEGVQAETYVCAAGIVAGYAAQQTFLDSGKQDGLQIVTLDTGRRFLFGEPLNEALYAQTPEEAQGRVINIALGTAASLGAAITMDDVGPMFARVTKSISDAEPFFPSPPPPNRPLLEGDALLGLVWPRTLPLLEADFDETHRRHGPVPKRWWSAVCARPAARAITDVKDVLDPKIAATLLLESAIYASKYMEAKPAG